MRQVLIFLLVLAIGFTAAFAQQDTKQKQNRKLIQQFEKQRFMNKIPLLTKTPTQNQRDFNILSYTLNLDLWPTTELLEGSVVIQGQSEINGLDHVEIDLLSNMIIDSVIQNGSMLTYTHVNNLIDINLPSAINQGDMFSVEIFYSGNPAVGDPDAWGWSYHAGVPIIWTLSQPFGSPAWWPCKDDPNDKADSVFINVTVPNDLIVASNGLLMDTVSVAGGRHTYFWETHYPISTYLVSLAITNYVEFSDWYVYSPTDSMEIKYFVYPEDLEDAREDFNVTDDMIEFFASIYGEYPFINEKYGNAEFPWGGGMEHQTLTSYGQALIRGDHYYDWLNAHEVAHQWFGDCITMRRWSHIWLNEGFASYSEALWEEFNGGSSAYHAYMESQDPGFFQGSLFVIDSLNPNSLFSNTVYDKGSWTLHMLRGVIGDSLFFDCVESYVTDPNIVYATAITEDLQEICETVTGQDLNWFFQQWVYRPGRPDYVYNWETTGTGPYQTTLNLLQTNDEPYKMPVQIHLFGNGLDTLFTVWDSLSEQQFQFITDIEPIELEVDPDNWILKNLIEGDIYTILGQVIDIADSSGVADAEVFWAGPYDPFTGGVIAFQIGITDINGNFEIQSVNGEYSIQAFKTGYMSSPFYFHEVISDTSGIVLSLSQPQASYDPDSLYFALENSQEVDTAFKVSNIGNGEMAIQVIGGNFTGNSMSKSKEPLLYSQFPVSEMKKALPPGTNKIPDPVDSLWVQIHHDVLELPSNDYDLADTYVQGDDNTGYIKITTHAQPNTFNNLRINIALDTDYNFFTGAPGLGADYLIAVGNFGGGFQGVYLYWNYAIQGFDFIGPVDYFQSNLNDNYIVAGLNRENMGYPGLIRIIIDAYDITNMIETRDFIPGSNLGYLVTPTGDSWLGVTPHFGSITSQDSVAEFLLNIDPSELNSGFYSYGVTVFSSYANGMERDFIPINLDYTTGITDNKPEMPTQFEVSQNYPNPFNPVTRINIALPQKGNVTAEIFNILGQKVYFKEQILPAGYHTFVWDSRNIQEFNLPSGIYFYRISNGMNVALRKMVLLR